MPRAFTRAVSPRLAECELTHLERRAIDAAKASAQHAAYERALASAGLMIIRMPELPDAPDAVFVEDTAILLDDHAIITRPGAPSRASETPSTEAALSKHFDLHRIECGHVDGGDVMRIGKRLYVGLSTRTDHSGIEALGALVRPLGFEVIHTQLRNCLHLKTGVTFAGPDLEGTPILLYAPQAVDPRHFEQVDPVPVASGEISAANCVRALDRLILPAGNPKTADKLRARGLDVLEIDVSELQKAEAGVTCMSLIDERP